MNFSDLLSCFLIFRFYHQSLWCLSMDELSNFRFGLIILLLAWWWLIDSDASGFGLMKLISRTWIDHSRFAVSHMRYIVCWIVVSRSSFSFVWYCSQNFLVVFSRCRYIFICSLRFFFSNDIINRIAFQIIHPHVLLFRIQCFFNGSLVELLVSFLISFFSLKYVSFLFLFAGEVKFLAILSVRWYMSLIQWFIAEADICEEFVDLLLQSVLVPKY